MNAADIIEQYGRGIPAIVQATMIVDVCAYLRSCKSPGTLILSDRGDVKGVLSQRDIIHASGRLGSSVMQMTAGELAREMVPVCEMDASVTQILELLSFTASDFVLVTENGTIKGIVTLFDTMDIVLGALSSTSEPVDDSASSEQQQSPAPAQPVADQTVIAQQTLQQDQQAVQPAVESPAPLPPVQVTPVPAGQPAPVMPAAAQPAPQQPAMQQPQQMPAMPPVPDVPPAAAFVPQPVQVQDQVQQPAVQVAQQPSPTQNQQAAQQQPAQHAFASFSSS